MSNNSVTIIPHGSADTENIEITGDEFYPTLSTQNFRDTFRVDTTIPDERVKAVLVMSCIKINEELKPLKVKYKNYDKLTDVPAIIYFDVSELVQKYTFAIFNEAKASLTEKYRDFDSTNSGHKKADLMEESIEDYRRKSRELIRSLLQKPRATIKLI